MRTPLNRARYDEARHVLPEATASFSQRLAVSLPARAGLMPACTPDEWVSHRIRVRSPNVSRDLFGESSFTVIRYLRTLTLRTELWAGDFRHRIPSHDLLEGLLRSGGVVE